MTSDKENSERIESFDVLRVLATLAVVVLHLSAQHWADVDVTSRAWFAFNLYDSAVRWAVPVFVMISGALFLSRNIPLSAILRKNVLRIAIAFVFWSAAYALIDFVAYGDTPVGALMQFFQGHYHMWFLFMIVGLYLIIPLLQKFVPDTALVRYFLLLGLVFTFLLPQLAALSSLVSRETGSVLNTIITYSHLQLPLGFTVYFVGGYYLSNRAFTGHKELVIYSAGIAGFLFTVFASAGVSAAQGTATTLFYGHDTFNVLCMSAAIFVFARQHFNFPHMGDRARSVLRRLSKYSFGVYLVHPMVIELLQHFGIDTFSCNAFFSVPLLAVIVFAVSLAISAALNRLPFFKRFV